MATLDRNLKEQVDKLVRDARPDQIRKLLQDIGQNERAAVPKPTHNVTERLQ